jgi:hypothetical protein
MADEPQAAPQTPPQIPKHHTWEFALAISVLMLLMVGVVYVYSAQKQPAVENESVGVAAPIEIPPGWKTHKDPGKGYEISYPPEAEIYTNDLSCIGIYTPDFGSVYIQANYNDQGYFSCGGWNAPRARAEDAITIGGIEYKTSGKIDPDISSSYFSVTLYDNGTPAWSGDDTVVRYGVTHYDRNTPGGWEKLGKLTEAEYQQALDSARTIASTIRLLPSSETTASWNSYKTDYFSIKYPPGWTADGTDTGVELRNTANPEMKESVLLGGPLTPVELKKWASELDESLIEESREVTIYGMVGKQINLESGEIRIAVRSPVSGTSAFFFIDKWAIESGMLSSFEL